MRKPTAAELERIAVAVVAAQLDPAGAQLYCSWSVDRHVWYLDLCPTCGVRLRWEDDTTHLFSCPKCTYEVPAVSLRVR